jgi:hypothetical protein
VAGTVEEARLEGLRRLALDDGLDDLVRLDLPAQLQVFERGPGADLAFDALLAWAPFAAVKRLELEDLARANVAKLFAAPLAARHLELDSSVLPDDAAPVWASQLESLELHGQSMHDAAAAWPLVRLRELVINVARAAPLAAQPALAGLRSLTVLFRGMQTDDLRALACAPAWSGLESLMVHARPVEGAARALEASALPLRQLTFGQVLGRGDAEQIAACFPTLRELTLSGCDAGDAGARAIAARPWPLRTLGMPGCRVGDEGALAIAGSPALEGAIRINLRNNPMIGERAIAALRERFGRRIEL